MNLNEKVRLGISECLLGHKVRHDGAHKLDNFLVETLGQYVEYVPVCPEVECGLSVPREAMRLVGSIEDPKLVTNKTGRDLTEQMKNWAKERLRELEKENLCGFVFKSKSPSSGMERVKVYDKNGVPRNAGIGIFARMFMEYFPLIPVEEEGRLHDPKLRETFIEAIFVLRTWRDVAESKQTKSLIDFHARHKFTFMAHSPKHLTQMGQLVATAKTLKPEQLYKRYEALLVECLRLKTNTRKNTNVLQHMAGYFKTDLSIDEKQELGEVIQNYHSGYVPLIVPVTLIRHFVRKYQKAYLADSHYLNPHPLELQLRNHA